MIVKFLWPTTPKTRKKHKNYTEKDFLTQESKKVALKLPQISLNKGYLGGI